jgi:hypothetical protein
MKRGLIIIFIGIAAGTLWLYVVMTLNDSGYENLQAYFLGFLPPLAIMVVGLCYLIYAVLHMTKVRRERLHLQETV